MELGDVHSSNPVMLGYYDPFNVFPQLRPHIEQSLPLKDLRWKYHASKPLKSISSLPLNFVEEIPKPSKAQRVSAESVSNCVSREAIYARLMFVLFDNLATYRSQVRPLIKEWLKHSVLPSDSDWMVIFHESPNSKASQPSLIKKSGFEKLKLDFGPGGKEFSSLPGPCDTELSYQVLKVVGNSNAQVANIDEVLSALKSLVLDSFDKKYQQIDGTKSLAAREPLNDLISKTSLACLLRDMRILHDALELFAELSKDVDSVYALAPESFDIACSSSASGSNETNTADTNLLSMGNFASLQDTKINLFDLKSFIFANTMSLLNAQLTKSQSPITSMSLVRNIFSRLLDHVNGLRVIFCGSFLSSFYLALVEKHINVSLPCVVDGDASDSADFSDIRNEVVGLRGELRHLQRSLVQDIGISWGHHIDTFGNLHEDIDILDEASTVSRPAVTDPTLRNALSSTTLFVQYYENLTEQVLKDFITCGRTKSVDMLSIDMALIKYRQKQYRECADILCGTFDFFLDARWEYVGGFVLDVYIDCLEELLPDTNEELVLCYLKFLGILKKQRQEVPVGINNYTISKLAKEIGNLIAKLEKQAILLLVPFHYQADKLFGIELSGPIKADQSTSLDCYYLELLLENSFPISFQFQSISLVMEAIDGSAHVTFTADNITISESTTQTIKLSCDNFKRSTFMPTKISMVFTRELQLNYMFVHENDAPIPHQDPNDTVINRPLIRKIAANPHIQNFDFEADPTKLWCELKNPSTLDLSVNTVILRIHNAINVIENCNVHVTPISRGLDVLVKAQDLHVNRIEKGHDYDIILPHANSNPLSEFEINVELTYEVAGTVFEHTLRLAVDTALMISVSVHDIFKATSIYSKFSIGPPANMLPIKILSTELIDKNQNYVISSALTPQPAVVAVFDQPCTLFYRVSPKPHHVITSNDDFKLSVKYISLRDECARFVDGLVKKALIDNGISFLYFPIRNHLWNHVSYDAQKLAAHNRIVIFDKDAVILAILHLAGQHTANQDELQKISVILGNVFLDISEHCLSDDAAMQVQEINIGVAVPLLDLMHIIDFDFERKKCFLVGEPIDFKLRICSTTRWKSQKVAIKTDGNGPLSRSSSRDSETDDRSEFQGIIASDENWLISGFRKFSFQVSDNADSHFEANLTLIPLNIGKLRLPRINIRSTMDRPEGWLMDVVNENGMETLLVLSDLETLTFSF